MHVPQIRSVSRKCQQVNDWIDVEHISKQLACCSFVVLKQKTANSINIQQINENRTENEVQLSKETRTCNIQLENKKPICLLNCEVCDSRILTHTHAHSTHIHSHTTKAFPDDLENCQFDVLLFNLNTEQSSSRSLFTCMPKIRIYFEF